MSILSGPWIDDSTFHADIDYLEALWQPRVVGTVELPVIDIGEGEPCVFVPILEHLEFVYARQIQALSQERRVILYKRQESHRKAAGMAERVEELKTLLDSLGLGNVDLLAHGDAAMVLYEFAIRYPERCRSLVIVAQGADYRVAPHPLIWCLHELYMRLPGAEYIVPAALLRRIVINYITARAPRNLPRPEAPALPRHLIEEQFGKIQRWPSVYKFSVLPVIHSFDITKRLKALTMPVLLINRADDRLSPEKKTRWLAEHLPDCMGYFIVPGKERFFFYSQAESVTPLISAFLAARDRQQHPA